jgi:dihydrofolate reductase
MPKIVLVAAVGKNRAIGRGGKLPWRLADDLKRFKALTTGHAVLMGRKTFESLPHGALPDRRNLVLSRRRKDFPGAETFPTLEAALAAAGEGTVFAIGGESVYREAMPLAEAMHLTLVDDAPEADAFFPEWNPADWEEVSRTPRPADARNGKAFAFVDFRRAPHRGE